MKPISFILLFLAFTTIAHAQGTLTISITPQSVRGGDFYVPTSGSNNPTYITADRKLTAGISIGGTVALPIKAPFAIVTGLGYSSAGQRTAYDGLQQYTSTIVDNFTIKSSVSLHYLRVPALIVYAPQTDKKVGYYVQGGIYVGILAAYKRVVFVEDRLSNGDYSSTTQTASGNEIKGESESSSGNPSTVTYPLLEKPFHSTEIGFLFDGGLRIKNTDHFAIRLGLAFNQGIRNVKNETSQYTDSNASNAELYWKTWTASSDPNKTAKYRNRGMGLSFGFEFGL